MPRTDPLLKLHGQIRSARSSIGVRNRQPQGTLSAFTFGTADVFDDTDTADLFLSVPDRVYVLLEVKLWLMFREFFTGAKAASSGGGSTSGSSSASSSGSSSSSTSDAAPHSHPIANYTSDTPGAYTKRKWTGINFIFNLETDGHIGNIWNTDSDGAGGHAHGIAHTHGITHTHSVSAHEHALTYGVYKEPMPASHSVTLKVYNWDDDAAWDLVHTISGITTKVSEHDLTLYITGPGLWRLSLQSAAGQPQGGRLGVDAAGHVIGAIQSV